MSEYPYLHAYLRFTQSRVHIIVTLIGMSEYPYLHAYLRFTQSRVLVCAHPQHMMRSDLSAQRAGNAAGERLYPRRENG
jgi:hypothetical protein